MDTFAVIHIFTGPLVHNFAAADQRVCQNCPQIYSQGVILAAQDGRRVMTNPGEARQPGRPRPLFAARDRGLVQDKP